MRGGKEKGGELVSSEKVVYLQVENKNADENRNSEILLTPKLPLLTHCSLLTAHCSLLIAHCFAHCFAHCSLLIAPCSLLCSLLMRYTATPLHRYIRPIQTCDEENTENETIE